jgi:hypothetical protein
MLLNVQKVSEVRQIGIHTADPLATKPTPSEVEIATAKLKNYKSIHTGQIAAELFGEESVMLRSEIHKLINYNWHKKALPEQWHECIVVPNYKEGSKTDWSNYRGISLLSTSHKIVPSLKAKSISGQSYSGLSVWVPA